MKTACLTLAILLAGSAFAAGPGASKAAAAALDPAAIDAALKMLDADDFEGQIVQQTDVMIEGMLAVEMERISKQSDEPPPADLMKLLTTTLRDHSRATFKANAAKLKRQAAEIYAREFTVEELRRLSEIAADPVIAKQRAKGQTLNAQLMMLGVDIMRDAQPELETKIEQIVTDYLKKAGELPDDKS